MTARVPYMITQMMRANLRAAGYTDADIAQMTPAQAWEHLGGMPEDITLSDNGELALSLAARGWYVFPCREQPGKPYKAKAGQVTPQVKAPYWDKTDLRNGKDDATAEPELIRRWWGRWPGALVGIYCEKSGIWALDVDIKNGVDGGKSLNALCKVNGTLPVGAMQKTPTGGMHLLFTLPQHGGRIPNNAGKLGAGLDLRSDGYICTGMLPDGNGYTWLNPENWTAATEPGVPAPAPAWLVELARKTDKQASPAPSPWDTAMLAADVGAYWLNHFLQSAVNGNRNSKGFDLACQLRDSGLSETEAAGIMREYAARVPGAGYTEAEALASLNQVYQSPRREPAPIAGINPPATPTPTPPQAQRARFRILTMADALKPQPPICWLVDKLFTPGSLNIVFGLPGTKKTWALLDMAVCVAAGAQWLGMPTQAAPVLVVDEESGERRLLRRMGEVIRGHAMETANLPINAVSLAGFNLRNAKEIPQLEDLILQTGAGLVVIDALADIMPGADENAVKDVQPVMLALRQMADRTQSAIILIHHANKGGMEYRGSTALPGAVDCMIQVTSATGAPHIAFDIVKSRDGEPFKFAALAHWEEDTFTLAQAENKTKRLAQSQHAILEQIADAGSVCPSQVTDRNALYELKNAGYVYRSDTGGQGARAVYSLTKKGSAYLDANLL